MGTQQTYPQTVEEILNDYQKRKAGIMKALTQDVDDLFRQCDPAEQNLCLYGLRDGTWQVGPPAEEVPPELPEPCLGINFARDGMPRKEWLALLAVHSDTWLLAVAFYYGVKLEAAERLRLFKAINTDPTLFEVITDRSGKSRPAMPRPAAAVNNNNNNMINNSNTNINVNKNNSNHNHVNNAPESVGPFAKRARVERPHSSAHPTGRPLTEQDVNAHLQGREAELYWPDDRMWYLVEIQSLNVKTRRAKIVYASGEFEDVDLAEILRDGHMRVFP